MKYKLESGSRTCAPGVSYYIVVFVREDNIINSTFRYSSASTCVHYYRQIITSRRVCVTNMRLSKSDNIIKSMQIHLTRIQTCLTRIDLVFDDNNVFDVRTRRKDGFELWKKCRGGDDDRNLFFWMREMTAC